jgi:hypothetical protein
VRQLAEVARIIDRGRDPREKAFELKKNGRISRLNRLYVGAVSGTITSDEVAATEVFGVTPQDSAYATAKSRLKRRLLNAIMLLNLKRAGYSKYSQAQYSGYRTLFIVQSLLLLGGRRVAMKIAKNAIVYCKAYHLTGLELELLTLLRTDASLRADSVKFTEFSTRIEELLQDLQAESRALSYYGELVIQIGKRSKDIEDLSELATQRAKALAELPYDCATFSFRVNFYRINFYALDMSGRFKEVVKLCDEALAYFNRLPEFASSVAVSEFAFRKLDACLKIRDLENGEQAASLAKSLLKEGSNNWFMIQSHYCYLLLHSSRFEEAYRIVGDATGHPRFANLPTLNQEQWKICELHVLYAVDRLESEGGRINKVRPDARLDAIKQVAPTLSQDKQGHKVSLLILHILYLLEIGDFNGIIDRMEALKLYRARYLKASQFPKTASFFKLLQIMENNSFNYKLVKEKGEKEYQKLIDSTENQEEINAGSAGLR